MTFKEYQQLSRRTAKYPNADDDLVYPTLGLVAEAGEVANKYKKVIRDKAGVVDDETREALAQELGDVLWYIAQVATELHLSLEEVAKGNIDKLSSRLERGTLGGDGDNR